MKSDRYNLRGKRAVRLAIAGLAVASYSALAVGSASALTSRVTRSVVVSTATTSKLGTFLVSGKTLYALKPSATACTAECLTIWPELTLPKGVTHATAGRGVTASKLGTIKRANGVLQVTYKGMPLYWFSGDHAAGQVHGNISDTWGKWSTIVTVKPSGSTSGSGSGGGGNTGTGGTAF